MVGIWWNYPLKYHLYITEISFLYSISREMLYLRWKSIEMSFLHYISIKTLYSGYIPLEISCLNPVLIEISHLWVVAIGEHHLYYCFGIYSSFDQLDSIKISYLVPVSIENLFLHWISIYILLVGPAAIEISITHSELIKMYHIEIQQQLKYCFYVVYQLKYYIYIQQPLKYHN